MTYNEFVQLMERSREIVPEIKKECLIVKNKSNNWQSVCVTHICIFMALAL